MYIGKVLLTNEWEKLEDLIKTQVSGQSSFAFDMAKTYQLQCECFFESTKEFLFPARLCETSATPSLNDDGFRIVGTKSALYQPSAPLNLYVRADLLEKTGQPDFGKMYLKISTVGE